jgi:hypothetical protein
MTLPEGVGSTPNAVHCPFCGRYTPHYVHARTDAGAPADGDYSVCWKCRRVSVWTVGPLGTALRAPTEEEAVDIQTCAEVRDALYTATLADTPTAAARLHGELGGC